MNKLLTRFPALLLALACGQALAQAPVQRNSMTTNNPGKLPGLLAAPSASSNAFPVVHVDNSGADVAVTEWPYLSFTSTNALFSGQVRANTVIATNILQILGATASTLLKADSSKDVVSIPNGAGFLTNDGSGGFGFTTNITQDVTVNNFNATNVTVLNTLTVKGKSVGATFLNGTVVVAPNFQDSATAVWSTTATTNLQVNPTNLANAQISASAAIAKSKISTSGTWAAADLPTIQSTAAGGSMTVKLKNYIVLVAPHSCDGAGAVIYTNDNTKAYFGQAAFSASAATNANYVEYRITVPEDIDTSVDLKVERWKFRLGAADTGAQTYNIGMASVADSASYDSPTLGQWVALSFAGDASGASGDVETVSNVTLTSWKSNVTAGQLWVIRVNRDGTDASTQTSYSGPLVISYGSTQ